VVDAGGSLHWARRGRGHALTTGRGSGDRHRPAKKDRCGASSAGFSRRAVPCQLVVCVTLIPLRLPAVAAAVPKGFSPARHLLWIHFAVDHPRQKKNWLTASFGARGPALGAGRGEVDAGRSAGRGEPGHQRLALGRMGRTGKAFCRRSFVAGAFCTIYPFVEETACLRTVPGLLWVIGAATSEEDSAYVEGGPGG